MTTKNTRRREPASASQGSGHSVDAARRAAAILDVLAGQRTAAEAAQALGISVNHYYLLEKRALAGLTAACEHQAKGRNGPGLEHQVQALQRELERCQRECMRQTALVRLTQRTVGLAVTPEKKKQAKKNGKSVGRKRRKRRPQVRALRAAEEARKNCSGLEEASSISQVASKADGTEPVARPHQVKESSDATPG